jgi:5-(aminomethyl)-3-furanmethanol phosphate kinase
MALPTNAPAAVIKVGGSLFDLPDLGPRLQEWLKKLPTEVLFIPGGGAAADVVRHYDRLHRLGEERAHWLALSALALNARFLASLLLRGGIVPCPQSCAGLWLEARIPVLDAYWFARADEGQPGSLPHSWTVTSDSLAARVAQVTGAGELILLKSVSLPAGIDWVEAGKDGLVDEYFAQAIGNQLPVRFLNFRQ